ncbi:hypothetical protein PLICRDRAFT_542310 [Plicaturopsis crispa FD-325 SS-3]|nr:hypothetical protein PLICRDRAFT_542310 [Plicaturopsis crispa FD-325 SS-3]
MPSQSSPTSESPHDMWAERSILSGMFLGAVAYGIHVTLFVTALQLLFFRQRKKADYIFLAYISINFILGTIGNAADIKIRGEMAFIDFRDFPGGPSAYIMSQTTNPLAVMCHSTYLVSTWLQDGLILYRFWLIWYRNIYLIVLPALMYATSIVLSCILIADLTGNSFWAPFSVDIGISFWAFSIVTNILLTVLIVARLLVMRYRLNKASQFKMYTPYMTLSTMLVESAFLYSATGLVFLVSYAVNSPVQNLALPALGQIEIEVNASARHRC